MSDVREVIIIGSGPTGYTAAIYTARANLAPLLFTGAVEAGGALITPHQANVPVVLDGVGIMPGDYVLADGSGAVIIPGAEIDEVLLGATAVKQEDARFREQIAQERASAGESARGERER